MSWVFNLQTAGQEQNNTIDLETNRLRRVAEGSGHADIRHQLLMGSLQGYRWRLSKESKLFSSLQEVFLVVKHSI